MLHECADDGEMDVNSKRFIAADDLLIDSFKLAAMVFDSGFRPDFLIGLWRGGSSVGIAVQEGLEYFGAKTDHIAVRTSYEGPDSYTARLEGRARIRVHGLRYLLDRIVASHSMLIVDDVYGTGSSARAVVDKLARKARRNLPRDIRIATVWYRPSARTLAPPDYHVHETGEWLVLPYELDGLSSEEIRDNKPGAAAVVAELGLRAAGKGPQNL